MTTTIGGILPDAISELTVRELAGVQPVVLVAVGPVQQVEHRVAPRARAVAVGQVDREGERRRQQPGRHRQAAANLRGRPSLAVGQEHEQERDDEARQGTDATDGIRTTGA